MHLLLKLGTDLKHVCKVDLKDIRKHLLESLHVRFILLLCKKKSSTVLLSIFILYKVLGLHLTRSWHFFRPRFKEIFKLCYADND